MTRGRPILLSLLLLPFGLVHAADAGTESREFVRSALAHGKYPWYDAARDRVQPLDISRTGDSSWLHSVGEWIDRVFQKVGEFFARVAGSLNLPTFGSSGNLLPFALIVIGGILLVVLIWRLWNSAGFSTNGDSSGREKVGRAGRIISLPEEFDSAMAKDPWSEADARRRRGDYSGAVIYLFAHQLLELDRLGVVRLTPGGTGRKYVTSVRDPEFRGPLSATLDLFEQAYYGHKRISAPSFDRVWESAQNFQNHLALMRKHSS